jgi:uncharacterized metal-binding protein YceD (DUF177 family)
VLLDLSEIVIREGMRSTVALDQAGVEDPDLVFVERLRGTLNFVNGGDLVNIDGEVHTTLALPCSRCLADAHLPVSIEPDEHFPIDQVCHPNRQPEEDDELDIVLSTVIYLDQGRPILDLDELLRQWLVAELPIRILCKDDCAGLCTTCGANLNETTCTCAPATENKPLGALASLLEWLDTTATIDGFDGGTEEASTGSTTRKG